LTFGELRHACDSIPFMAAYRLVIVHGLLTRLASGRKVEELDGAVDQDPSWKRAFREQLAAYLPALPSPTELIFVEPRNLAPSDPVLKAAQAQIKAEKEQEFATAFPCPRRRNWWVGSKSASGRQGQNQRRCSGMLAMLIGRDLRLLDQEVDKLLTYAGGERPVTVEDVRALVSRARETSIFDLVDCVGGARPLAHCSGCITCWSRGSTRFRS